MRRDRAALGVRLVRTAKLERGFLGCSGFGRWTRFHCDAMITVTEISCTKAVTG